MASVLAPVLEDPAQKSGSRSATPPVIIIGAGLAGLFTALKLAPMPVTVVCSAPIGRGASSAWAQGGIAAAIGDGDLPAKHAADTINAGAGLVDPDVAHMTAAEAADRINDLLEYGVPFDRDLEGRLRLSREAAHGERRIVRVKGDGAGRAIMAALIDAVHQTPSIELLEGYDAKDFCVGDAGVTHVVLQPSAEAGLPERRSLRLAVSAVVLATGGVGQLFHVTTNPATANGDGLAMAYRAGAVVRDPEFVQFHPTAIVASIDPAPLATEALRGEGAVLVNGRGERFMLAVNDAAELAPRDVVARAVHREVASGRGAFLDTREAVGTAFPERFPTVFAKCLEAGLDPVADPIPVAPAAHYHMGGVLTDMSGRTTIDNLWACGEVASTGLHGANRLASNSLLEAVVFAARIAEDLKGTDIAQTCAASETFDDVGGTGIPSPLSVVRDRLALRKVMALHCGVERTACGLDQALETIDQLGEAKHAGLGNMLTAARLIVEGARARAESRGGHFRSDYPATRQDMARSTLVSKDRPAAVESTNATASGAVAAR